MELVASPLDSVSQEPARRRSSNEILHAKNKRVVRNGDDRDTRRPKQTCDRSEHLAGIDNMLEHFCADDAIKAGFWQIHLVDLTLQEADVVSREVPPRVLQVHARHVDCGEPGSREHAKNVSASRTHLGDLEPIRDTDEIAHDRESPTLDESDWPGRSGVVLVARMLASEPIVYLLHVAVEMGLH